MKHNRKMPLVVLISGSGSNLQAIIDHAGSDSAFEIKAVICNQSSAYGLVRAANAGIETAVLDHKAFDDRESYDRALAELVESFDPELVVLAGFMRILTPEFVDRFAGKMLNIHPSLLPKYRGLHTHQRALDAGDTLHGASVHFVTAELDGGPVILQAQVPIQSDDDADSLAARVLTREHIIYPTVVRWFAEGRLTMTENNPMLDGEGLVVPRQLKFDEAPPQ